MARPVTRRPKEPQPPKPISDAELARARPDQIEEAIAAHSRAAKRITALPDPGRGLPRAEAQKARQAQLATMEAHGDEIERLQTAYEMTSPEAVKKARFIESAGRAIRRKGIAEATKPSDREFIAKLNENLLAKQREREARAKIRETAELMTHPPDPRASSIAAAVMVDPALADGMREKMRPDGKGGYRVFRAYDFEDIGVLFTVLHLLEAGGRVHVKNVASTAVFADHELPRVSQLGRSLVQLRRNGWLEAEFEGGDAYYVYGERIREISKRWGIALSQPPEEIEQATA